MQQIKLAQKEYKIRQKGGEGDSLGIIQEIKIRSCEQMVYAWPRTCPGEWDAQIALRFWDTNESRYVGLTDRKLRKLWNMRLTVIPVVAGTLGMVPKGLVKRPEELEIGRRIEKI